MAACLRSNYWWIFNTDHREASQGGDGTSRLAAYGASVVNPAVGYARRLNAVCFDGLWWPYEHSVLTSHVPWKTSCVKLEQRVRTMILGRVYRCALLMGNNKQEQIEICGFIILSLACYMFRPSIVASSGRCSLKEYNTARWNNILQV